jgi:peptidoglycan hydrolase-like protein with peptidoglycan-binding domain
MKKTIAVIAFLTVPALASAQAGLSKIQFLALQQELRDQGCGVTNVDGHYGPQTRRAIATCAKKFNSANNAAALLAAMNIGFGASDNPPTGRSGTTGDNSMTSGSTDTSSTPTANATGGGSDDSMASHTGTPKRKSSKKKTAKSDSGTKY